MNEENSQLFGFKVVKFLDLYDWKTLEVTEDIPLISQAACPCEENPLSTFVSIFSEDGSQKIRLGLCKNCGYLGYIDRPSSEWIRKFYFETWDEAPSKNMSREIREKHKNVLAKDKRRKRDLEKFLKSRSIDKSRPVLEIGSGYGGTLEGIRELGFEKLIGLESSPHRAKIASEAYGLKVLTVPFEDKNLQTELKKYAPFSLILTHHVLEHTYNPGEILKLASLLQKEGDYLVISVPNAQGEFSMSQIFYFPHLHSFTPKSLEVLLNRNGYSIVDDSLITTRNLYVLAKRKQNPEVLYNSRNYFSENLAKFIKTLELGQVYFSSPRRLWWDRKIDVAGQVRPRPLAFLFDLYLKKRKIFINELGVKKWLLGKRVIQTAEVSSLTQRFTSFEDSPFEIQFEGNIKLTYK